MLEFLSTVRREKPCMGRGWFAAIYEVQHMCCRPGASGCGICCPLHNLLAQHNPRTPIDA